MGVGISNHFRGRNKVEGSRNSDRRTPSRSISKTKLGSKRISPVMPDAGVFPLKSSKSSKKDAVASVQPLSEAVRQHSLSCDHHTFSSGIQSPGAVTMPGNGGSQKSITQNSRPSSKRALKSQSEPVDTVRLSRRAQNIVKRVEGILSQCRDSAKLTDVKQSIQPGSCTKSRSSLPLDLKEEIAMYEMFALLHSSRFGDFYANHLELFLSNRSAVLTTPDFPLDWNAVGYHMCSAYVPGTIGRSYLAVKDAPTKDAPSILKKRSSRFTDRMRPKDVLMVAQDSHYVLKVINFVLRKEVMDAVISEQQFLKITPCDSILGIVDVLCDDYKENVIVVTDFLSCGNVSSYAGKLDTSPSKLLDIISDVALGLRFLNFNNIHHHNLKLENVLEMPNERFCIADAGFSSLFTSQCPEALVFNGELGCLAPEVFSEDSSYADDAVYFSNLSMCKIDTWGFGVFMYCLAYGSKPFDITKCDYNAVKNCLLTSDPCFPEKPWPFAADLVKVISLCLTKDVACRPDIEELLRMPFFTEYSSTSVHQNISPMIRGTPSFSRFHSDAMLTGFSSMRSTSNLYQKSGYTVDRFLGRGIASETFLVHLRRNTTKHFTLKAIHRSIHKFLQEDMDEAGRKHVLKQLAVSKKIIHPNLVQYLSIVDNKKGNCFVVQEYIEGDSLLTILGTDGSRSAFHNQSGQLDIRVRSGVTTDAGSTTEKLQKLLADVLSGLTYLHENDIPHLSLRPSNVIYDVETKNFKLTDYGPLFLTMHENSKHTTQGKPFYQLPDWILQSKPDDAFMVDTFCVGLLAASIVPKVWSKVWAQLYCAEGKQPLSVDEVLKEVSLFDKPLPESLVSFIHDALYDRKTARQLLQHSYFEGNFKVCAEKSPKIEVSSDDLSRAILTKPEERDEPRILEALGWVSFVSSPAPSVLVPDTGDLSVSNDKPIMVNFGSSGLQCTLCGAKITLALYRCLQCEDCIRCGKCALNDNHKPGHQLMPFLVSVIELKKDGSGCAFLCHPCSILDVHALETIEMQANFPVGSLSKMVSNKRFLERSLVHGMTLSTPNNNVNISGRHLLDTSYATFVQESADDSSSSVSAQASSFSKRFSSVFSSEFQGILFQNTQGSPFLNPRASFVEGGASSSNMGKKARGARVTSHTTQNASERSLMCAKSELKVVTLPKAQDVEDITWEEELERCRRSNQSDLMLFNYCFTEVPVEVYTPPPLHVVYLDLSQNLLTSLPDELSCMMHLRKLVVSYNKLISLPDSIGNLSQLEVIDASHNALEHLPNTFVLLSNLQSIAMDYNNFCEIPKCILNIKATNTKSGQYWQNALEGRSMQSSLVPMTPIGITKKEEFDSPALKVLYLAANDRITTWPKIDQFKRFETLTIALDNEPALYHSYMTEGLEAELPNIIINWNKIYPDEVIPHLYCGSLRSAQSQMVYRKLDISYVLTIGRGLVPVPPDGGSHKVIVVDDIPGADISYSFQEAADFINESQEKGKGCLVHCFSGLSRSATIVIAYLMTEKKMRLDEAYMLTKKGRPAIFPNKGFLEQLILLDKRLYPNASRPLNFAQLERYPEP